VSVGILQSIFSPCCLGMAVKLSELSSLCGQKLATGPLGINLNQVKPGGIKRNRKTASQFKRGIKKRSRGRRPHIQFWILDPGNLGSLVTVSSTTPPLGPLGPTLGPQPGPGRASLGQTPSYPLLKFAFKFKLQTMLYICVLRVPPPGRVLTQ